MILEEIAVKKKLTLENDLKSMLPKEKGNVYNLIKNKDGLFIIGEIKKASPSKGLIVEDFDPAKFAKEYNESKIDAISVLTEKNYFLGNIDYISLVRQQTNKPILRKDFIIDPREIIEAKQRNANLILLIVALLSDEQLREFYMIAYGLGLECIVEVHNEEELERAMNLNPEIIGINNRNLKTFEVSLTTTEKLRKLIPNDIAVIGESGIHTADDVARMRKAKVDGLLIGESFMRAKSIESHYEYLKI